MTREREITEPVDLCRPDGTLNPDAVGWSRRPLHRSNLRFGPGRWGRNKRWEYWGIVTPTHCIGVTASSLDYAGVLGIYVLERATGREWAADATVPLALGSTFPDRSGAGWVRAASKNLSIEIHQDAAGSVLAARGPGIELEVTVPLPQGHESMAVVVPWSPERFQYTVKDVARPASGALTLDGVRHEIAAVESYAVLDHGRGRWPYRTSWFWGAGSGPAGVSGVAQGIQVGGRWTDGTGSTENAVLVDGRVHKLGVELAFDLDPRALRRGRLLQHARHAQRPGVQRLLRRPVRPRRPDAQQRR